MEFKIINEDFNKDEIDNIHLIPGKDIDFNIDDFEISIWWHTPSINLSYYPIIQIDKGDRTVLNREGPENPDNWDRFAKESIKKVLTKYGKINEDYDDERLLYKQQLSRKLNESSDGWDESKLYDLSEILDEIYNLQYEVQNTVRGAYTNAHTYEELGYYVHNLGSNLMDIGDEIMEMEEEDEEDED